MDSLAVPATDAGPPAVAWRRAGLGAAAWALGWAAMLALDGRIDLSSQALLLVLSAALAALWWPLWPSLAASTAAVAAFNWCFVPPRGSFSVGLHQHLLLLTTMAVVGGLVAAVTAGQRRQADQARRHRAETEQLRAFGEALRDADDPAVHAGALQQALGALVGAPATLLLARGDDPEATSWIGSADDDERAGLRHALRRGQAMGPGTGRHDALAAWYLPLRGRGACFGAALLRLPHAGRDTPECREQAQALCDQFGLALQRQRSAAAERAARDQAQAQAVRNALLAAISHDYRTPLATILGAASALQAQHERLSPAQRERLATTIVDETRQLARLTDNTLQLARLDAPGVQLRRDWESPEEIVGAALRRARAAAAQRDPARRLSARLEPGLPLVRCDALLLGQLLDNLVDNALKHTPSASPIEILVRRPTPQQLLLAVRDRGPGVPPSWRERVFETFERGPASTIEGAPRAGAGVGLAVCRAIARAHGGELRLRARGHGGCSFECTLPLDEAPPPAHAPEPG